MPVNGNIQVQRSVLPDGIAGVDATVKKVVELAHSNFGSKSAKIRAAAIDIVRNAGIQDKDYFGEIVAIHNWVRDNIRYVRDPIGQETLSYPEETLFNSRAGDCDDMTTLEIALLGAIGMEAYPVVIGMFPNHFSHIYLHAKVPEGKGRNAGKVLPLDPIMKNWPAGREAANVKAKKLYAHMSNPLTMNGLPMSGLGDLGDIGAYAIAPSYLDTEDSHAGSLVVPDAKASHIHNDKTVANSTRVNMPFEGLDGLFGGGMGAEDNSSFSSTSAGDGGTIVQSGGQMVPKGFIRNEPDLRESMAMTPATLRELGPRGPIFAQRAAQNRDMLQTNNRQDVVTLSQQLKDKTVTGARVEQKIGQKRYTLPSVQQASRVQQGLAPNKVTKLDGNKVVVLNSISLDRLGQAPKPCPTLGEELAGTEMALAGAMRNFNTLKNIAAKPKPLAQQDAVAREQARVLAQIATLERKLLALRQKLRTNNPGVVGPHVEKFVVRAAGVSAGEREVAQQNLPVSGFGEESGVVDFLKKPIVWGSALAFVGVFALRMYLKKRRAAATAG